MDLTCARSEPNIVLVRLYEIDRTTSIGWIKPPLEGSASTTTSLSPVSWSRGTSTIQDDSKIIVPTFLGDGRSVFALFRRCQGRDFGTIVTGSEFSLDSSIEAATGHIFSAIISRSLLIVLSKFNDICITKKRCAFILYLQWHFTILVKCYCLRDPHPAHFTFSFPIVIDFPTSWTWSAMKSDVNVRTSSIRQLETILIDILIIDYVNSLVHRRELN